MILISTNFGTFKIVADESDNNKLHVSDPLTNKALLVIRGVHWWDKDGITRALYKGKDNILKMIERYKNYNKG